MTHRYSLNEYTIIVNLPANFTYGTQTLTGKLILGGPGETGDGSFLGGVIVSRSKDMWTTEGDYTGSWVHNKNCDKTGTIGIDLRQVSDDAIKLNNFISVYENTDNLDGFAIQIVRGQEVVVTATDCLLTKYPDLPFGEAAQNLKYNFTCGKIDFKQTVSDFNLK